MKNDLTLIAYVPVVHRGYAEFFCRFGGASLLVLGESILNEIPHIARDMRALQPFEVARMIRSLDLLGEVSVVEPEQLSKIDAERIIMPDEEVSRTVAEKYLSNRPVKFERVFLRWDKKAVTSFSKINPDHTTSLETFHQKLLGQAYLEAALSSDWWRQVGAVIVRGGTIVCAAHNTHMPSEHTPYIVGDPRSGFDAGERIDLSSALHGEVGAIAIAARKGIPLLGADIYVTTFPCTNCARAVAAAGFKRVFYAEGYSQIEGEEVLRSRNIEIVRVQLPEPSS